MDLWNRNSQKLANAPGAHVGAVEIANFGTGNALAFVVRSRGRRIHPGVRDLRLTLAARSTGPLFYRRVFRQFV